eukprot:COSAG06_NODE_78_length_25492_cov_189.998307_13_plen_121_part_00
MRCNMVVVASKGGDSKKVSVNNPLDEGPKGVSSFSSPLARVLRQAVGGAWLMPVSAACCAEPRVLNAKEIKRVKQVFAKIDVDGSGHIDMDEVRELASWGSLACLRPATLRIPPTCLWDP